jgi:hypothetical protein
MRQITKGPQKSVSKQSGEVSDYRPNFSLKITKKISPVGYLFIGAIYTAAVVITTINVFKYDRRPAARVTLNQTQMKQEILDEIRNFQQTQKFEFRFDRSVENKLEQLRSDMLAEINRINIKYIEMIERNEMVQQNVLNDLKKRAPASVHYPGGETFIYNKANKRILRFKHKKEYTRLEESLKKKKNKLLTTLDLSRESDQEKLKDFNDQMEFALYELKQNQKMQRDQFEKQQYLVLNP